MSSALRAGKRLLSSAAAAETRITALANGLRVVTEPSAHQTATIGVHVDAGSRFETAANNGTAHFLEHMAFKGTNKRGQADIDKEAEQRGMRLDAYTSRESTVYMARCFSGDVNFAVDLLGDILTNAKYDAAKVEAERDVILRENQEVNSIPEEVVMDYLHATAFQNSPLGYTILGPEENIKSITRDDLVKYVETYYTGPRMVLVGTGGVDHDELVAAAEKAFGGLSSEDKTPAVQRGEFHGSELRFRDDAEATAKLALAVEGVSWSDSDFYSMLVGSSLVGSWDRNFGGSQNLSSPLARLTAENSLAHNYMSFQTSYKDTGLWGCYAVTDYNTIEDFLYGLTQEWLRLAHNATDAEVERVKRQLKSHLIFSVDSAQAVNDEIGRQILTLGHRVTSAEINKQIDAVSASSVRNALMRNVYDRCPAVAAVGPVEQLPDYNRLRSTLVWLRT
eukprot:m.191876 g.191876  ORF g.191876 m.191876 type:complete len:450 (-) comp16762_c9_seq4:563-1912(-)